MKITKKIVKEVEVVDDILCNNCGESLLLQISDCGLLDEEPEYEPLGLVGIEYIGSYFSTSPIVDMVDYNFNMCEKCLAVMFANFKIPAEQWNEGSQRSRRQIQEQLNQIHRETDPNKLAEKMLDDDITIRRYSELRYKKLTEKQG